MGALVVYKHRGRMIDHTPDTAVTAGDVVVQEDLVSVALHDIAADRKGALAIEGVFDFPKDTGSSNAISAGAKVYWDEEGEVATTTAGENKQIGKAVEAASAAATTVRCYLSQ